MTTTVRSTPPLTSLQTGHVALNVTDLARSQAFYEKVLGLRELARGDDGDRRWAFLARDGRIVVTLFQQSSGTFDTASPGLHHLSFQVESLDQVQAAEQVVRQLGAKVFHDGIAAHAEGADSGGLFFEDPDGIRLEIYAPTGVAGSPAPSREAPTCGFF
jgi:catechol 2,3-dioxygenase-like lactoylglutathione lyase family enzyme